MFAHREIFNMMFLSLFVRLVITNCGLEHAPLLTFCKSEIVEVNFGYNHIKVLPQDYFHGCIKLERVVLRDNQLVELPEMAFVRDKLRTINIGE